MIDQPGIYTIPEEAYHRDPVVTPSLSNSLAVIIDQQSPMHAWHAHPKLNPSWEYDGDPSQDREFGSAFHQLLLEKSRHRIRIVKAADYKKKEAQEARRAAYAEGAVPLLEHRYDEAQAMVKAVYRQLEAEPAVRQAFSAGKAEQTVVWQERGIWCRSRIDWLPDDPKAWIFDLKTTGGSAEPASWIKNHLFAHGYDMQADFHPRGLRALGRRPAGFGFIVIENKAPYALSVVSVDPASLDMAHRKVDRALDIWERCLKSGRWPGYGGRIHYAEAPPWEERRVLEREATEGEAA